MHCSLPDIAETITITNNTAAAIPLHFFQYSNFDIGGPGGDTVQLGKNLAGLFNEAVRHDPLAGLRKKRSTRPAQVTWRSELRAGDAQQA